MSANYEKTMRKLYEAKLVNEGLDDLEAVKTVDGEALKAKLSAKYGI